MSGLAPSSLHRARSHAETCRPDAHRVVVRSKHRLSHTRRQHQRIRPQEPLYSDGHAPLPASPAHSLACGISTSKATMSVPAVELKASRVLHEAGDQARFALAMFNQPNRQHGFRSSRSGHRRAHLVLLTIRTWLAGNHVLSWGSLKKSVTQIDPLSIGDASTVRSRCAWRCLGRGPG